MRFALGKLRRRRRRYHVAPVVQPSRTSAARKQLALERARARARRIVDPARDPGKSGGLIWELYLEELYGPVPLEAQPAGLRLKSTGPTVT